MIFSTISSGERKQRWWFPGVAILLLGVPLAACGGNTSSPSPAPTRIIGLSGSLAFGSVQVGSTATLNLIVTNTGNATLTVTDMTVPPGSSGVYSTTWASGTIPPGGSQTVPISFRPTNAQSYNGTLTVIGDWTAGTNTTSISGTGVSFAVK